MENLNDKSIDWLEGYLSALYNYATWHDGEMVVGCGIVRYVDIKGKILKIIEEKKTVKGQGTS